MSRLRDYLLRLVDRFIDFTLGTPVPKTWDYEDELHQAICRHPAGKGLRPGN